MVMRKMTIGRTFFLSKGSILVGIGTHGIHKSFHVLGRPNGAEYSNFAVRSLRALPRAIVNGQGKSARASIKLDDVSFGYAEGQTVLKNISLDIKPGEVVAIVGPSGSGDSGRLSRAVIFAMLGNVNL